MFKEREQEVSLWRAYSDQPGGKGHEWHSYHMNQCSQTVVCVGVIQGSCQKSDSALVGLQLDLRCCTSNKLPGAAAAGPGTTIPVLCPKGCSDPSFLPVILQPLPGRSQAQGSVLQRVEAKGGLEIPRAQFQTSSMSPEPCQRP